LAANELARGGDFAATLAALGRCLDVTVSANYYNPQGTSTDVALLALCPASAQAPRRDRYRLLRDWTLPSENRRSVRVVAGFDSGQPIPMMFLDAARGGARPTSPNRRWRRSRISRSLSRPRPKRDNWTS